MIHNVIHLYAYEVFLYQIITKTSPIEIIYLGKIYNTISSTKLNQLCGAYIFIIIILFMWGIYIYYYYFI